MLHWSGRWGACCPRGNPLSPSSRRRVEVWERWVAQLGKGGQTLPVHLACLRGAQSGWGRSDHCPSAPGLVRSWEGTPGYAGARCKSWHVKRGGCHVRTQDPPSGKGPPFAHKRGRRSKGWCGGLCSESSGARVKGRDGVPFVRRSGSSLVRQGGVAQIPRAEDGETPAHVSSRRHTRHTPACFAAPVVRDHLHGNGCATGAVHPSIQPSCPPPSYPKHPCLHTHSTHGEWGRGRGNHRANGRGLHADTVSAPPPRHASPFTCKGIGGVNGTRGREECPLSPHSIHDTERGGRENGPVRVRGRGEEGVQGTYQARRRIFLAVLATRSCDVREGTARPGFCS